jgi:hypothetical protein
LLRRPACFPEAASPAPCYRGVGSVGKTSTRYSGLGADPPISWDDAITPFERSETFEDDPEAVAAPPHCLDDGFAGSRMRRARCCCRTTAGSSPGSKCRSDSLRSRQPGLRYCTANHGFHRHTCSFPGHACSSRRPTCGHSVSAGRGHAGGRPARLEAGLH